MCQDRESPDAPDGVRVVCPQRPLPAGLTSALLELGLTEPRPVLILVGGAARLSERVARQLLPLFAGLAPHLDALGAAVIDGGTAYGVMALMGRARRLAAARFRLIGIAPRGTVALDHEPGDELARLDPNHTHLMLIPGAHWGDESPWIIAAAEHLAGGLTGGRGTLMLVAGGGAITWLDVLHRLRAGGQALVLAGSGGTADRLAEWRRGACAPADQDVAGIDPRLIEILDLADAPARLPAILTRTLGG